ncbi:MAG: hypothetical protein ACKO9T_06775 [Nitrospira sp.]
MARAHMKKRKLKKKHRKNIRRIKALVRKPVPAVLLCLPCLAALPVCICASVPFLCQCRGCL